MKDSLKAHGQYHVEGYDINTREKVFNEIYKNVVCQNYFDQIFNAMSGLSSSLEVTEFATGDGTTTAQKSDTTLESEQFRKPITQISNTETQVKIVTQLDPAESNFLITEIGLFLSDGGIMSRVNTNIDKNASTKYNITYTLTIV